MQNGRNIFAKYSPPNPPTSPSASSDPSATGQTPPVGKIPALHPTGHEPAYREYRWSPPPELPVVRHPASAPDLRLAYVETDPPPDVPAPQQGWDRAYCDEIDRGRYLSSQRWTPASNMPVP